MTSLNWWNKAFDQGIYPLIELGRTPGWQKRTHMEVSFIVKSLRIQRPGKILDACCGAGRHALELARRGFQVTGVDISSAYLSEARKKAAAQKIPIQLLKKDVRKMEFREEFDAAINIFTSFGYFPKMSQDLLFLKKVCQALKPSGYFLLDTYNFARSMKQPDYQRWTDIENGTFILEEGKILKNKRVSNTHWIILSKGKRRDMDSYIRIYDLPTLSRLLRRAGFKILKAFGEMHGAPYHSPHSTRLILLSQKPA